MYLEIPIGRIEPNPKQPRQVFDEEALAELVHSVREIGILRAVGASTTLVRRAVRLESVVICGYGRVGSFVAETLRRRGYRYVIIVNRSVQRKLVARLARG